MGIATELQRYLNDSSLAVSERPTLVVLMGGIGAGKSTLLRSKYATGFVVVDAGLIFQDLMAGRAAAEFPGDLSLERRLWILGKLLARTAIRERRNILIEIIGAHEHRLRRLIEAMRAIDYHVSVNCVSCDPAAALLRSAARTSAEISAFDSEPYQLAWLHGEAMLVGEKSALKIAGAEVQLTATQEDCLNAINAMNVAVDHMRAANDEVEVPQRMSSSTGTGSCRFSSLRWPA